MSSTSATAARCTACRQERPPEELLLVHIGPRPAYAVCRPTAPPLPSNLHSEPCFRVTGPAALEPIEQLSDFLARQATT